MTTSESRGWRGDARRVQDPALASSGIGSRRMASLAMGRECARRHRPLGALAAALALALMASAATRVEAQAIIDNGTVQLGVDSLGQFNIPGGTATAPFGTTLVGLRYVPLNLEATSDGSPSEGWGAGDTTSGDSGGVNNDWGGGWDVAPVSFAISGTGTLAESVGDSVVVVTDVGTTPIFRVTHDFHPSIHPNLYEAVVTIENLGAATATPVYRRMMDWDPQPTPFSEFVTIELGTSTAILYSSNDGFQFPDPITNPAPGELAPCGETTSFTDCGPSDHGALLDFAFDPLDPGETVTFQIYYGAAPTETTALAALAAVGAEVYTLGQCDPAIDSSCDPIAGTPATFMFGFTGVGGEPIFPECSLEPSDDTNPVGTLHSLTATVTQDGSPVESVSVEFAVISGPHTGTSGFDTTSALGEASFAYTGTSAGIDTIQASGDIEGQPFSCLASKEWTAADVTLAKAITAGPDEDGDSEIDLVVEVGQLLATAYEFEILYANPGGPDVVVLDTVPAEWVVSLLDDDGGRASVEKGNKKGGSNSATKIRWEPDAGADASSILVQAVTRQSPGRRNSRYAPTSCGALVLNDGAVAYELDASGDPLTPPLFGPTAPLCLAAVRDIDGGGLVGDGTGDEDGDGFSDFEEACELGTDPCVFDADSDSDGVPDSLDPCPLDPEDLC